MSNGNNIRPEIVDESADEQSIQGSYNVKLEENRFLSRSRQNISSNTLNETDQEQDKIQETKKTKFNLFKSFSKKPKTPKVEIQVETPRPVTPRPQKVLHFSTKVRNTGFWGKVTLRKGTWLVIIGLILISFGLTVISVFWRWWYGPEVNIPCRAVGVTLLVLGCVSFLFGMLSNSMMIKDPLSKHFIGSPPRLASWILLVSIFGLAIASVLMTIYYTYWHNRYVNNTMISFSIILFFFSPIALLWSLVYNFKQMVEIKRKLDPDYEKKVQEKLMENQKIEENRLLDETINETIAREGDLMIQNDSTLKKDFRKKNLKIQPRTVMMNNPPLVPSDQNQLTMS